MRAVVQRVSEAWVRVQGNVTGKIGAGLAAFVAFGREDNEESLEKMSRKISNLRIFPDEDGKMSLSVHDISGGVLVISNFTLYGDARKGNRPNFCAAAPADEAEKMYNHFIELLSAQVPLLQAGVFQAMMDVSVLNDGPVTIMLET